MTKQQIEKLLEQAVRNGEGMLVEGGSVRIGFTGREVKIMAQVIYDDLAGAGLLGKAGQSDLVSVENAPWVEANRAAKELGRRGGLKGGRARAEALTKEERSDAARKAVEARWEKHRANEAELGRTK